MVEFNSNIVNGVSRSGCGGAMGSLIGSGSALEFQTLSRRCWARTCNFQILDMECRQACRRIEYGVGILSGFF